MRKKSFLMVTSALMIASLAGCNSPQGSGGSGNSDYYTVTFNFTDDSSRPFKKEVEKGSAINEGPSPVRDGYDFDGWYTAAEGGDAITFPYTANSDVNLYAHWSAADYDVTFDLNYEGAPAPTVMQIAYGQSVEPTETPTRDNYVFRYWTLDQAGERQAKFPYQIKKDITFYASWRDADIRVFTVTVHYGDYTGAPADLELEIEEGSSITKQVLPDPESRGGYDFLGWSLTDGGSVVTFPYTPTGNIDLYAVWEAKTYSATFNYNYTDCPSTPYAKIEFAYGADVTAPQDNPTRDGYVFGGWYAAEKGGDKLTFPRKGYRNLSYYAHWVSNPVTTNVFQAEYCYFDPNEDYPGYSGSAKGDQCIIRTSAANAMVDTYPTNSARPAGNAFAVSYQYKNGAFITFEINAVEAVTGAELWINWSSELLKDGAPLTFGPANTTCDAEYDIFVNNAPVAYPVTSLDAAPGIQPGPFKKTKLGSVNLVKGKNTIMMTPNNDMHIGTTTAAAPVIDYIEFANAGASNLNWAPMYDNLDGK